MPLKKKQFSDEEIAIFDEAVIYKRGDYWHFRMWLNGEGKYARKSLRTRSQSTAIEKGKEANGNTVLTIRYGSKPLELAKGKQAIKLASNDDVVKTLKVIAEAVEAGELDRMIEQQTGMPKLKRKA